MAPLSTYTYPNFFASCFANVLLPQLDQPSIAIIIFLAITPIPLPKHPFGKRKLAKLLVRKIVKYTFINQRPAPHKNRKERLIKALLLNFVINLTLRFSRLCFYLFELEFEFIIFFIQISFQQITRFYVHVQYLFRKRIFQIFLNGPVQRTCSKLNIVSLICQKCFSIFRQQ